MAIKKAELRPKLPDGTYDDIVYLKTSVDMVDGLNIKNNLIETTPGNVLDATQGKALNDKIQSSFCPTIVHPSSYSSILNWALANKNKFAAYEGNGFSDAPTGKQGIWGDMWNITGGNGITVYFKQNNEAQVYCRCINDSKWIGEWKQLATIERIDLTPYLRNGWSCVSGFQVPYAVKVGNLVTITCRLTGGTVSHALPLMQLPSQLRPSLAIKGHANNDLKFAEINVNVGGDIICSGVSGGMTNGSFTINMTYSI